MFTWKMSAMVLLIGTCLHCYAANEQGATQVNFKGRVIDNVACTINNDQAILVKFDRITPKMADGKQVIRKLDVKITCMDEYKDSGLKMQIVGTPSTSDYVMKTSLDDMGIVFYQNQTPVELHKWFNLPKPAENLQLTASPLLKENSNIKGGDFNASATLLVSVQ